MNNDVKDPTAIKLQPEEAVHILCPDGSAIELRWTADGVRVVAATGRLAIKVPMATEITTVFVRASVEPGR